METEHALRASNLSKSFPGIQAVSGACIEIGKGTVHALMGENGAGKSTLAKILAGFYRPDAGEVFLNGVEIDLRSPHDAIRHGITMIHQELLPFPELTVTENIFMGRERVYRFAGWLDRRRMQLEAARLLERLGVPLSPSSKMKDLSVAGMQAVEIAKALAHRAEVIIMDEPTSALSEPEVDALFRLIRDLKGQGVAVIFISHRMDEVFRIADAVTVMRDGCCVGTHEMGRLDPDLLIGMMVGRRPAAASPEAPAPPGGVVLEVCGLGRAGRFADVRFEVRRGEILGIAGLMGAGRTELASALFGLEPPDRGEIRILGRSVRISRPRHAMANGIAMVTEDRRRYGLVAEMSVAHNITLSSLRRCCRMFWIDRREEGRLADERMRAYSIRARSRNQKASQLSGGNQQKVVMAKALLAEPDILLLDEPTRGIDIGAKAEIYTIIRELARAGKAVVLISSELPEILSLSHRILVMQEGRIAAELNPGRTTQEEVMRHAIPRRKGRRLHAPA